MLDSVISSTYLRTLTYIYFIFLILYWIQNKKILGINTLNFGWFMSTAPVKLDEESLQKFAELIKNEEKNKNCCCEK